jgi:Zn-dependent peptidase ImmA (M78 family)
MSVNLQHAERDAANLLRNSWWITDAHDLPIPVDPIDLARGLGILVTTVGLPSDQSGSIEMRPDGSVEIRLNQWDHENRRRFTCAHEIGHYLRRKGDRSVRTFTDYRSTLAGLGVDSEEIYANQFAAALLMPAHLVKKWFLAGWSPELMARQLGTSEQAMHLRLRNLALL